MEPPDGSVTRWLDSLKTTGDPAAVEQLWQRYFARLVGLARGQLACTARGPADEEDVAPSAFDSFCRAAAAGRFPRLHDRDGLWRLLVTLTLRKAGKVTRDEGRQKRGGGAAVTPGPEDGPTLEDVLSGEPDPAFAAEMADQCEGLLRRLAEQDPKLREIALLRLQGYTVEEIAARIGYVERTVKRKLDRIRDIWGEAGS
jgi:DNA-directed RNA polymerase specialized sigma24 family protein